jgi:omega-6 fatty acid desaturase (delta-12 desaturase)
VILVGSIIGVWLFAVRHRFETTLWARQDEWDFTVAALRGSSYLRLPKALQWLTGNIGFHHVHHLAPRVPNYRLEECHNAVPALSLWSALKSLRLALWDENGRKPIGFKGATQDARRRIRGASA